MRERILIGAAIVLLAVGLGLTAASQPMLGSIARWLAAALLAVYATGRRSLAPWIVVAMVAGAELGADAPHIAVQFRILSDLFLRLIHAIVAPLILATLVTGIAGHGDMKSVGRIAWKSIVYFEIVTTLALVIGLVAIHIAQAGVGLQMTGAATHAVAATAPPPQTWQEMVLHVFPENLAKSIAEGQILQVSVFAVLFGIGLAMLPEERRLPVLRVTEGISEAMFQFTNIVMYLAPLAVGAALAYTVGQMGTGVLINLGKLVVTYYGALIALAVLVLLPVMLLFRLPVMGFIRAVAEPASIGFATSASEAALPRAMEAMEMYGVPRKIVAFVIPAGYSFNMDGAAVYLTLAAMFVAQAAGMHPSLSEQIGMVLLLMLASKGVSGVPRATLMVLMAAASSLRLPPEPIFVILGVDAIMDMGRTATNVVGNCLASAVVARWEGEFGTEPPSEAVVEGMSE
ncbi:MAG TPA: dicarboxylate/amino acid:cation symporter [Granulicella sp.]